MGRSSSSLAALAPAALAMAAVSCSSSQEAAPPASSPATGGPPGAIWFVDITEHTGIRFTAHCGNPRKEYIPEVTGSGVALGDYDGDGDLDIYLATAQTRDDWLAGRRPFANALYRNNGDGTFTDVAAEAGVDLRAWTNGAYFADYDGDGDVDLFLTCTGPNVLYRNNGDGTFTDVTAEAGLGGPPVWSSSAAFGDLDGDGDLDLYVANYVVYDMADPPLGGAKTYWRGIQVLLGPLGLTGIADRLYRNNGDGTFTDVTAEAGLERTGEPAYGLGVVMTDLDGDGDLDIYVANDSVANDLWLNHGGWRFENFAPWAGVATNEEGKDQAGMGTDAGDYNGDGRFDLVVTNFSHDFHTLYRNEGNLVFTDATFEAGLNDTFADLSWGVKFADLDQDGWVDLVIANGHIYPEADAHPELGTSFRQRNSVYRNTGRGRFENVTAHAGPGFGVVESSRGLALGDLDGDGDLDLVVTNLDAPAQVLRNDTSSAGAWLQLRLVGSGVNTRAVGARVELQAGGRRQVREVNPFGSYLSQSDSTVHFGVGDAARVERLTIRWPDGSVERYENLPVRRLVTIAEGRGVVPEVREAARP